MQVRSNPSAESPAPPSKEPLRKVLRENSIFNASASTFREIRRLRSRSFPPNDQEPLESGNYNSIPYYRQSEEPCRRIAAVAASIHARHLGGRTRIHQDPAEPVDDLRSRRGRYLTPSSSRIALASAPRWSGLSFAPCEVR